MGLKIPKENGALMLIAVIIFGGYIIPITLTLGNQEITNEEISFQIFLFSSLLFSGVIGTFGIYFARYWWRGDNKYGDSFGFFNIGEKPALSIFKRFTAIQLTFLSLIVFSIIFLLANFIQTSGFTGSKVLPQQFSPGESLVFSSLLIPFSEESMSIFLIGLLVLGLVLISVKYKISPANFVWYYFGMISVIIGSFAVLWHNSAYAGSTISLFVVFTFWTLKTFLVLLTGFFMVGWAMHFLNNFFIDFTRLYSSSFVFSVVIISIIILIATYTIIYRGRIFGGKIPN